MAFTYELLQCQLPVGIFMRPCPELIDSDDDEDHQFACNRVS